MLTSSSSPLLPPLPPVQKFPPVTGDRKSPWPVSSTGSHPGAFKSCNELKGLGRSIYFAFRGKMVRASGNAPEPGTDLEPIRIYPTENFAG